MTMEHAVRSVYGSMKPLPGAEERMWQAIDDKLKGKGNQTQIKLRPRRSGRPLLLAAAAILALVLVTAAVIRQMPGNLPADELPADQTVEPTPEGAEDPVVIPQVRQILLVNARVDGKEILELTEEGRYLARALLPEGYTVDHWEINEEPVDAGNRLYSLEFDSEGVWKVEAVLREELRVTCVNAYLRFLDESGAASGALYSAVSFEYDYTVPTTGELHPGGTLTVYVSPLIPNGQEVDYWLINGEKVEADNPARGILLQDLDHSVVISAVLKEGEGWMPRGDSYTLTGRGQEPARPPKAPDDLPEGTDALPTNSPWEELDASEDDVPIDPDAPTPDGHEHVWKRDYIIMGFCTGWDAEILRCEICEKVYVRAAPGEHNSYRKNTGNPEQHEVRCVFCDAFLWNEAHSLAWERNQTAHYQRCSICGYQQNYEEHTFVYDGNWQWSCSVCGYTKTAPPPDYNPTDP